jgi:glycosyltransferase involved in cell wall biosynthesis
MSENWVLTPQDEAALTRAIGGQTVRRHATYGVGCELNGFDPTRFSDDERRTLRMSLGIDPGKVVLLYIGRKVAFKGFAAAVRSLWRARQSGHDAHLIVVGTGDAVHSSGLSAEEEMSYRRDPHITDLGWQDDVAPYLAIADLTVIPSIREGMSVAMMESLAMGVPVVTSDRRGCGDVVRNRIDGVTLASVEPETVAEAVSALLGDRARLAEMAAEALRGRSRFDRKHYVNEQVAIYARLPGNPGRQNSRESAGAQ